MGMQSFFFFFFFGFTVLSLDDYFVYFRNVCNKCFPAHKYSSSQQTKFTFYIIFTESFLLLFFLMKFFQVHRFFLKQYPAISHICISNSAFHGKFLLLHLKQGHSKQKKQVNVTDDKC